MLGAKKFRVLGIASAFLRMLETLLEFLSLSQFGTFCLYEGIVIRLAGTVGLIKPAAWPGVQCLAFQFIIVPTPGPHSHLLCTSRLGICSQNVTETFAST